MSAILKQCFICEDDLSGRQRVKDTAGNYFCPDCWEARKSIEESTPASPATVKTMMAPTLATAADNAGPATETAAAADPNFISWPMKLGLLALALAVFAYCDARPLYQATHHANEFSISFNEMAGGWMALLTAIFVMLLGPLGIGSKLYTGKPMTESRRKKAKAIGLVFAALVVGLAYAEQMYIEHLGYTVRPWYEIGKPTHH